VACCGRRIDCSDFRKYTFLQGCVPAIPDKR
jgi:hypothetical protein